MDAQFSLMMVAFGSDETMKVICGQRSIINYLEKSNFVVACLGYPGYPGEAGEDDAFHDQRLERVL